MKALFSSIIIIPSFIFLLAMPSCKKEKNITLPEKITAPKEIIYETDFDSTLIDSFFDKHPNIIKYKPEVIQLYQKHQHNFIWYDQKGINEFGFLLYNKLSNLEEEGIPISVPYKEEIDQFYENPEKDPKPNLNTELLNSSLYFFYTNTVYQGIDAEKSAEMDWHLPRKQQSYVNYLDSLLRKPSLIHDREKGVFTQYFLLRDALKKYRQIEKSGGWGTITVDSAFKSFKIKDSAAAIAQIRERLFLSGDLKKNSKSPTYDESLEKGILNYKKRRNFTASTIILPYHIEDLNIPVTERIKTIMVNMERCRWISNDISKAKEYIAINIPAYQLNYFKKGELALNSKVVVGKIMNKTAIFSAPMKYIVFSPYWNVPKSILEKEILPEIAKNKNYLAENDMEWHKDYVRQRPGPKNALGLVKFLFPNSNAIYLHDTPAKILFTQENRAFSHGCIRVEKPVELANKILEDDPNWTPEKIDEAMHLGKENWYTLKNKIPVYIAYFTSWVDGEGQIHFYNDIYERDALLASILFNNKSPQEN